jgi:hypothetical protein
MSTQQQTDSPSVRFDPSLAFYVLMIMLMAGALSWSIAQLIGWLIALPTGFALTWVFSSLVKRAFAKLGTESVVARIASLGGILLLIGLTAGLGYGSIYAAIFAESSAVAHFQKVRVPVQRSIEQFLSNSQTAERSLASWEAHSLAMKQKEEESGGSCPIKYASSNLRGPIAIWRDNEASLAKSLHSDYANRASTVRDSFNRAKDRKANDFTEVQTLVRDLSSVAEEVEAFAKGAFPTSLIDTLNTQLLSEIEWPKEKFTCGDQARDILMKQAIFATEQVQKLPSPPSIAPIIDLNDRKKVASAALVRSFKMVGCVASFGYACQFNEDPLMKDALAKSLVNEETLPFGLALLIEACVLLTGALVQQTKGSVFPSRIIEGVKSIDEKIAGLRLLYQVPVMGIWAVFKAGSNLFLRRDDNGVSQPHDTDEFILPSDPRYPVREVHWAEALVPHWFSVHEGDYLAIPNLGKERLMHVARALTFQQVVTQLHSNLPFSELPKIAQEHLLISNPGAECSRYSIFKLTSTFAQALRLSLLSTASVRPGSPTLAS